MGYYSPRTRRGERAPNASLSREQVREARRLAIHEDYTLAQIKARLELRCSLKTIQRCVNGETYKEAG